VKIIAAINSSEKVKEKRKKEEEMATYVCSL
jgi:hypothetical protein